MKAPDGAGTPFGVTSGCDGGSAWFQNGCAREDGEKPVDVLSVTGAMERIGYDVELYLDLCRICLQEFPARRERMLGYPNPGGADEMFRLAHSCRNACGAIGAEACAALSARVEKAARAGEVATARGLLSDLARELARVERAVQRVLEDPVAFGLVGGEGHPPPGDFV